MSNFNPGDAVVAASGIAGKPPEVWATNSGKPAASFEKFPHKDAFIAPKDGLEK